MQRYNLIEKTAAVNAFHNHYGFDVTFPDTFTNVVQLNTMQAWVLRDYNGNLFLQSYGTLVSVKWADTHEFERFGKWSVTTSKQQTTFERRF